jgi:arylsulfatase A-like enzyme
MPGQPPVDGVSLVPLLDGQMTARPRPLGFMLWNGKGDGEFKTADFVSDTQGVWIDGRYKLVVGPDKRKSKNANQVRLFDIYADPAEKMDLADKQPEIVKRMQAALDTWRRDVRASYDGRDYPSKP